MTDTKHRLSRGEAIEAYALLRLRFQEISHLDFLLKALTAQKISLPKDCCHDHGEVANTIRTALFGWIATLLDRDSRVLKPFQVLTLLFPPKRERIDYVESSLKPHYEKLQRFRNQTAFHSPAKLADHMAARRALQHGDFGDLIGAFRDFQKLMQDVIAEEHSAIPELTDELKRMDLNHHPLFASPQDSGRRLPSRGVDSPVKGRRPRVRGG